MKILHLTLKKKWFDLIASDEKKYEYREDKPYWRTRLIDPVTIKGKEFDIVRFRNGYRKDAPVMDVECKGIAFTSDQWWTPNHGEEFKGKVIVINLGNVLRISNYNQPACTNCNDLKYIERGHNLITNCPKCNGLI